MFFQSWESLGKTAIVGIVAYAALILFLRVTGKRTLSKMNAFDLVITVALGSTLATIMVSKQTPLADGLLVLLLLILLQYSVTWLAVRQPWFRRLIKSEPTLLYFKGEFMENQLRKERVVRDEVLAAAREQGVTDFSQIEAVVLETDGSFSVVKLDQAAPKRSTLKNVKSGEESRISESTSQDIHFHLKRGKL